MRSRSEGGAVLTGACDSRRLQPSEFMDSRNEADAMVGNVAVGGRARGASAGCCCVEETCCDTGVEGGFAG